jgi:hypothetical protein
MLLVVLSAVLLNNFWAARDTVLGTSTDISLTNLSQSTNGARLGDNEQALILNDKLTQAAQSKANDMVARDYWSHVTPDGKQPWVFARDTQYQYAAIGENLAYGFAQSSDATNAWLHSPEHRANLLNNSYKDVGFGIAQAQDFQGKGPQTIIVALYAAPETTTFNQAVPSTVPGTLAPAKQVARADLFASTTVGVSIGVAIAAALCIGLVVVKHGRLWRKTIRKGERFVIKHPGWDLVLVCTGAVAYLLTRTSGFVH